jgi:hypothetical protein
MANIGSGVGGLTGPPVLGSILEGRAWATGSISLVAMMAFGVIVSILVRRRVKET